MREQKLSQSPRSAMRFNAGAVSFPPVDTTSGRNFPVVQSSPSTSRVAMGSPSRLLVFGRRQKSDSLPGYNLRLNERAIVGQNTTEGVGKRKGGRHDE